MLLRVMVTKLLFSLSYFFVILLSMCFRAGELSTVYSDWDEADIGVAEEKRDYRKVERRVLPFNFLQKKGRQFVGDVLEKSWG